MKAVVRVQKISKLLSNKFKGGYRYYFEIINDDAEYPHTALESCRFDTIREVFESYDELRNFMKENELILSEQITKQTKQ